VLALRPSTNGLGVFTLDAIRAGSWVMEYRGRIVSAAELPVPYDATDDRYVQVGRDAYLGPSGGFDDYVNHSCDPTCWLRITADHFALFALRDIAAGEELAFDYSTTMSGDDWTMPCACASALCRGTVSEFATLSAVTQRRYLALGIVPAYVHRRS